MEFTKAFRVWMKYKDLKPADFAKAYGCTRASVHYWMSGKTLKPWSSTIKKIIKVFDITEEQFWKGPEGSSLDEFVDEKEIEILRNKIFMEILESMHHISLDDLEVINRLIKNYMIQGNV